MADVYDTPEAAEAAFYAAFEACDADAMMQVWAERAELLCVHPNGPALTTRAAVERSWRRIFDGASGVRITLTEVRTLRESGVAVHYVHENLHHGRRLRGLSVVLATNVYVRERGGWRICAHHASPHPGGAVETSEEPSGAMH